MKNKGFTLIELLSVIVVLAILALIAIPIISGVVDKAKMGAAKDSTYGVLDASDLFNGVEGPSIKDKMVFKCDGKKCVNSTGQILKIKGTIPTSGNVVLDNKKVSSADLLVVSGYCFDGERENLKSAKDCYELDKTAPIVEIGTLITRKNSLVVTYELEEKESSIKSVVCKYGEDKNNLDKEVVGTETSCEIKNLDANKKYYYQVIATNLKGLEGKANSEGETGESSIEYSLTNPASWTKSKTATITFNSSNITSPTYYIKTSVGTVSNVDGYLCEGESEPGSCETTSTRNYVAGKWYKVTNNPSITFNNNGVVYALIHDGATYASSLVENVDYIDNEPPTNPTGGSIGAVSGSNTTGSIKTAASGSTDAGSGSITYKYIVTNTNSAPANTDSRFTTSKDFTRSCGTSYYAWAIAEDALGNRSGVVSLGSTSDGANSYSGWSGCSKSCGGGTQARTNTCALVTTGLSQSCNTQACCSSTKIGSYGSWSGWSGCTKSCGGGTQTRTRTRYYVSNYDGSSCGSDTETGSQTCNAQACVRYKVGVPSSASDGSDSFAGAGGGVSRPVLKYTFNTSGAVTKKEVCGYVNNKYFCLTGGDGSASYNTNKNTLLSLGTSRCDSDSAVTNCPANTLPLGGADKMGIVYIEIVDGGTRCIINEPYGTSCR